MNVASGFQSGFSFYYSATVAGTVQVYDGLNATGNILTTISLPVNVSASNCPVDASSDQLTYCAWKQIGAQFNGTARSVNFSGSANYIAFDNITIGASVATAPLTIVTPSNTTTSFPSGTTGSAYNNFVLSASGGTSPYTWTARGLPAGLTVTNGAITGTPTASGTFSVTVTVTDSTSPPLSVTSQSLSLVVNQASSPQPQLTCNPATGPTTVGDPYTATCTASSGTPGYTFSLSAGSLPAGLTGASTATTYTVSGKPSTTGAYNYTVQVKDSAGKVATRSFSGSIGAAPVVGNFSLTAVTSTANQYTASLTLSQATPANLTGTLCLTYAPDPSVVNASSYKSQEVVFANGTTSAACSSTLKTTLAFTIPSGSAAAVWAGNSSQFSQGTVAGTITVTLNSLKDPNGNSLLPSPAPSKSVAIPVAEPSLVGSPTMTESSNSVTVVFDGISSKRSVTGATYSFSSGSGQPMTVPLSFTSGSFAGDDQSQWFGTAASLATGGSFSLSATFSCTNCSALTSVQVALTN
jgi:hypothetical protein